jgi:hypothetical protein
VTRGPRPLASDDALDLLVHSSAAALCVDDGEHLRAVPVRILAATADVVEVAVRDDSAVAVGLADRAACLVADEFASYEQIRGTIARGVIVHGSRGVVTLALRAVTGFSFAGTLPEHLRTGVEEA